MDQLTIWLITMTITILNFIFALVRTYYNIKVTKGSEKYWASWKERSKDVARKVLEQISTEDLERELRRRKRTKRKRKKKRRKKTK